jgi:Probable Zinc-ribbon domain
MTTREPLSITHPELAKEADGWDPRVVILNYSESKKWMCPLGHQWVARINNRISGTGCPVCVGRDVLAGFNDLATLEPELAKEAFGWDPSTVTRGSGVKKLWICNLGHQWISTVANRSNGTRCPICLGQVVLAGFNDLATLEPELAKEAFGWDPSTVTRSSNLKKHWICAIGHKWSAIINSRSKGNGCPICAGQEVLAGFNDLATLEPELAKEAFGWDPSTVTRGSGVKKLWICNLGHQWSAAVSARSGGSGCPICSGSEVLAGFNDLATLEPELAKEAFGWDPSTVTRSSGLKKLWICNLGHQWNATIANRSKGRGCPICSGSEVLAGFNDLATLGPELAKEAFGWDPSTVTLSSNLKKHWICALGHKWITRVADRSKGKGCSVCSGRDVLAGFNDLATLEPELAKEAFGWDPSTVTRSSGLKKLWICNLGHQWNATIASRSSGNGCPSCAVPGFDPNIDGWLYFIEHPIWEMLQIGITNFPNDRLRRHESRGWEVLELRGPMDGFLAKTWESAMLRMLKAKGADLANGEIAGKFDGYSEAWSKATFQVGSIKELMHLTEEFEEESTEL